MRALFTTYEGGGHVPPALMVGRRLQALGHAVRLVSDEATRTEAEREALDFQPWRRAPNRSAPASASDPLRDWKARTPVGVVRAVCDAVMCRPALDYARDTLETLEAFRPDVVVTQELLFGVMAAAEAAGVKLALLTGNLWCFPTRDDVPPFGPGFLPPRNRFEEGRERTTRAILKRLYDMGLDDLNRARASLGLKPLRHVLDQLKRADLVLLGTSAAFDYGRCAPPAPFAYAGPLFHVPAWSAATLPPELEGGAPLVLVSFSTTFQDQAAVIGRCVEALSRLPVRGVVTLGPALNPEDVASASNVAVLRSVSHDVLVPRCAAVICHGGHGTLLRPLMHGVPVLCLPMGRDQPENAARVTHAGAGLRLPSRASSHRVGAAIGRLLRDRSFGEAAKRLGRSIAREADGGEAAAAAIANLAAR